MMQRFDGVRNSLRIKYDCELSNYFCQYHDFVQAVESGTFQPMSNPRDLPLGEKHFGVKKLLDRVEQYIDAKLDQHLRCRIINCNGDCEFCQNVTENAEEAVMDVLQFIDEHYRQTAL